MISPMPIKLYTSRRVLMPETRMIVNSELAASFDSAYIVPISAAIGINS